MKKARIFVVEDEAIVAKDLENSLKRMGYDVLGTASSGEKALVQVEECKPDLVMMDIKLKGKMNGIETASEIRKRFDIPAIYLTAHADAKVFDNAKLTEPFGYIIKPFEEKELGRTIEIALYRHKMELKEKWESKVNKALSDLYKYLVANRSSIEEVSGVALEHSLSITGCKHGYISIIDNENGDMSTIFHSNMMEGACAISPGEKKVVFPRGKDGLYSGLWGYCLNTRRAFFTNQPENHQAFGGLPEKHVPIHNFLAVPVLFGEILVGQIALANKNDDFMERDLHAIVRIGEFFALAIQKDWAEERLRKAHEELEQRVIERTAELAESNVELKKEMAERVKTEALLSESQTTLMTFLDSIPEAAVLMELSGEIVIGNKAFSESMGKSGKKYTGKNIADLLPREMAEKVMIYADDVVRNKRPRNFEFIIDETFIHLYIYPVFDSAGEVSRLASLSFNVTSQKQMERKLIQNEKLAAIGFLVSGVAHEINNPNNFITFNLPILRDYLAVMTPIIDRYAQEHPDFEPFGMTYPAFIQDLTKLLENIEHGSQRINATVTNLREFSRKKEKTTIIPVDVREVIEKAMSISQGKMRTMVKDLRVNVPEEMPKIDADPEVLEHILINLLINAAQASDKEDSWVAVNVIPGDRWESRAVIEVQDNGCGMKKSVMAKIFDPFYTSKGKGEGTGLGLSLCQNLASSLGGRIEVESEFGKGSTFRLVLHGEDRRKQPR